MTTILIADDVSENRYLLVSLFNGLGYEVAEAANGAEALAIAQKSPPDLIVTDILMPIMDGFELCRRWMNDERLKTVPFIFYTATYTNIQDERFALSLGAARFVVKPQKPEVLVQVARDVLQEVRQSQRPVPVEPLGEEMEVLRHHNEALFRKLESKVVQLQAEIAARGRVEEELRQANASLDSVIENIPNMIFLKDAESLRLVRVNRAGEELLGRPRTELLGNCDHDLFPKEQADFFTQKDREVLQARALLDIPEEPLQTNDKGVRILHTRKVPILNAEGEPEFLLGISEDVTEVLQLKEQLLASQRMEAIGRLAGGVAHDFNNLLTVILNCTRFAIEETDADDRRLADLEAVMGAGERAAALTRQLLAFSRKQVLEPGVLDVNQIVTDLEKMLRRLIGEDIGVALVLASDLGPVRADPGQIEQAIMNLVVNARDAMPDGGTLTIETANVDIDGEYAVRHLGLTPGPHVLLAISDTGCGMEAATRQRLFEPFFTTKAKGKGTGLGLSTVYGIVKQSGGDVLVYSEPGKGTTFKVYLPRLCEEVPIAATRRASDRPAAGNETILVVEDDEAVREIAARMLRMGGYEVLTAANAGEALQASEQHRGELHLLLTDVVMPEMSGPQLADQLEKLWPDLRVLYMSGYADDFILQHGGLERGTTFIGKPFSAAQLGRKVRAALLGGIPDGAGPRPKEAGDAGLADLDEGAGWAALRSLPQGVAQRLREAALAARHDELLELVERIRLTQPIVAELIRRRVARLDYEGILVMLGR